MELVKVTDMDGMTIAVNVNVIEIILVGYNDRNERCYGMKLSTDKYSFAIKETAFELLEQETIKENFVQCMDENGEIMLINKACIVSFCVLQRRGKTCVHVKLSVKEKAYSSFFVNEVNSYLDFCRIAYKR